MQIEKMDPVGRDRVRLTLDSGESIVLYKGELRLLKIREDGVLSDDTYLKIVKGILPKRAKLRAMNLLKARSYTEYQLRKKLLEGGYPENIADEALSYVKSFGYVNDREFARSYITQQSKGKSRRELFQKLQQKGIAKETLDAVFSECYGDNTGVLADETFDEKSVIIKALRKRGFTGHETYEEKQKILAYFYRRGFEMDKVYAAMEEYLT